MIDPPKSRAEAEKLTYGRYDNIKFDPERCCQSVWITGMGFGHDKQCTRPPGYGPDKLYCKQHDPAAQEVRRKKSSDKFDAKMKAERPKWYAYEMLALLKESQVIDENWRRRRDALIKKIEGED